MAAKFNSMAEAIKIADKLMKDEEFLFFTKNIRESIYIRKTQSPFPVTEKFVASSASLRSIIQRFLTHTRADLFNSYSPIQQKSIIPNVRAQVAKRLIDF